MKNDPIDWKSRVLCSDGTCIGVVGKDGRCKDCGKPHSEFQDDIKPGNNKKNKANNFKCKTCGFIAFGDDPFIAKHEKCLGCGNIMGEEPIIKQSSSTNKQTKSEYRRQDDDYFIFNCLFCDKSLRITFPFKSFIFRCSNCNNKYDIQSAKSNSGVYLVVPKLDEDSSCNTPPKKPPIPEEVKKAFHLFDLSKNASLADFKIAYRKCMAEYHPDKVSHLGSDLRKLAEEKTKAYNSAFEIIKKYFAQQ